MNNVEFSGTYYKGGSLHALLYENGEERRVWKGCYLNIRENNGPIQNGRVTEIVKNGFWLNNGIRGHFIYYSDVTGIWNIH